MNDLFDSSGSWGKVAQYEEIDHMMWRSSVRMNTVYEHFLQFEVIYHRYIVFLKFWVFI